MGHGTAEIRNATAEKKSASKLEPNPKARQARLAAEKEAAEKATKETAEKATKETEKPDVDKVAKTKKTSVKTPKAAKPKVEKQKKTTSSQFLELGCNFRIAHKPGSAYSTFYRVVAKHGNFEEVVKALEAGKYNLNDAIEANKLLEKMLVPVEKLEEFCRADESWKEHADKKTQSLTTRAKDGNAQAKVILKNESRCVEGAWSGNIPEMISTCVGYYNYLMEVEASKKPAKKKAEGKEPKPNKNVKKFQDAGLVFRRFPLSKGGDKSYVLMFPEKFVDDIKTAILIGRGISEDE